MPKTYNSPEHYHQIELMIQDAATQIVKHGDTAIDVGSNFLFHSTHLINLVGTNGKVLAFEPLAGPNEYGHEYVQQHSITNLELHNIALSNFTGTSEFYENTSSNGYSGLRKTQFEYNSLHTTYKELLVSVDQLDNFADHIHNLSFVKIDVEGNELNVLLGGEKVIDQYHPVIACEVCDYFLNIYQQSESELLNWMSSHKYSRLPVPARLSKELYIFVHESKLNQADAIKVVLPKD
jgi:FkbM family methyltransferase